MLGSVTECCTLSGVIVALGCVSLTPGRCTPENLEVERRAVCDSLLNGSSGNTFTFTVVYTETKQTWQNDTKCFQMRGLWVFTVLLFLLSYMLEKFQIKKLEGKKKTE